MSRRRPARPWPCGDCDSSFDSAKGLSIHRGMQHPAAGSKRFRDGVEESSYGDDDLAAPAAAIVLPGMAPMTSADSSSSDSGTTSSSHPDAAGSRSDGASSDGGDDASVDLAQFENSDADDDAGNGDAPQNVPAAAAAAAAALPPVPAAIAAGAVAAQAGGPPGAGGPALRPINTGLHALPKVPPAPIPGLTLTEQLFGGLIYDHLSNSAGDLFIQAVKHAQFNPNDLPDTAATMKQRIEASVFKSQPLFSVVQTTVPAAGLESAELPPGWKGAKVTSRGVVPCLMSILMNDDVSWSDMFHYEPGAANPDPGAADEPFFASVCQEGCADAIARGTASGEWEAADVIPLAVPWSVDGQTPDQIGKTSLTPCAVTLANLPQEIRRRLDIGQHACLFPSLPVGHTRSAKVTRDQRRMRQRAYQVFADDFNDVYRRGFVLHGSHIKGCPHNRPLLFMPFALGCAFDAEGAWHWCNSKHHHCFVCKASYDDSHVFPADGAALPPRLANPGAADRATANAAGVAPAAKQAALVSLRDARLNPELTAHDSISLTQMCGCQNVYPDSMHCVEGGIVKCVVCGVKAACGDAKSCGELGHAVTESACALDDFVTCSRGFNNGVHRHPAVKGFTGVKTFTAMMIRSLLFIVLAALCSMSDLFDPAKQDATVVVLVLCVMLVRNVNARRWTEAVPRRIAGVYRDMARYWDDTVVGIVRGPHASFWRPKVHLPSHFGDLYLALGTPIHWSTMYFIEPLQRLVKAAYRHSSKFNPDSQILRRLAVLGHVKKWIVSLLGGPGDRRRKRDEPIQAYLRGTLPAVPGVNTVYDAPRNQAEASWNGDLERAIRRSGAVPPTHKVTRRRIYVRREATIIREGLCDVTVRATPQHVDISSADGAERAVFSLFEPRADPQAQAVVGGGAAPGGVAAPAVVEPAEDEQPDHESATERVIVDWWISYDIRGLSPEQPNPQQVLPMLSTAQMNDAEYAVDIAIGRKLRLKPTVTSSGANSLREKWAKKVFQRVKPQGALIALDVGFLCQPLWAFPVLGDVAGAKAFFRGLSSKWDADEWLILPKLY